MAQQQQQAGQRGRGSVRGRGQGRGGFTPGHLRNLSASLSGLLGAIGDMGGVPTATPSLGSTRGRNRRGRGTPSVRGGASARIAASTDIVDPDVGSGLLGLPSGRGRKDLVFSVGHEVTAADDVSVFGPDAAFLGKVTGKNPVLEAIRIRTLMDGGAGDVAGKFAYVIAPNKALAPDTGDKLKKVSEAHTWDCAKFPRSFVKQIPHEFGVKCSGATKETDLPHLTFAIGVMRLRNGLTSTDKVLELAIEFLFTID